METSSDPLRLPELLNLIVGLLHPSDSDLRACALVARSWVFPTQSLLFEDIRFLDSSHHRSNGDEYLCLCFLGMMYTSPHLLRHICRLEATEHCLTHESFCRLCLLPFPRLQNVIINPYGMSYASVVAIQQLLSLPTLLPCYVWRSGVSSPTPPLFFIFGGSDNFNLIPARSAAPIKLVSLTIIRMNDAVGAWMQHNIFPFDISGLKISQVGDHTDVLRRPTFTPAHRTIEALEFDITSPDGSIDLSWFPNLTFLRLHIHRDYTYTWWSNFSSTLLTIAPANCIRNVSIWGYFNLEESCEYLDHVLSQRLFPGTTVELQPVGKPVPNVIPYFLRLNAMTLMRPFVPPLFQCVSLHDRIAPANPV
ncbi:hypothetical protein DFH07DRAFT_1058596 [Mycena maculata]|uniref:Uncharacterized protein n=1 Tax=Mycena maculata TaxID=230809 RepID=A0AAD7NLL7_9AGAR|nr:hypothetical protein DFH07DRAFT_1058596 [Mycena maculata]